MSTNILVISMSTIVCAISIWRIAALRNPAVLQDLAEKYFAQSEISDILTVNPSGRLRRKPYPQLQINSEDDTKASAAAERYVAKLRRVREIAGDVTSKFWGTVLRKYVVFGLLAVLGISGTVAGLEAQLAHGSIQDGLVLALQNIGRIIEGLFTTKPMEGLEFEGGLAVQIAAGFQRSAASFIGSGFVILVVLRFTRRVLFEDELKEIDEEIHAYKEGGVSGLQNLRKQEGRSFVAEIDGVGLTKASQHYW